MDEGGEGEAVHARDGTEGEMTKTEFRENLLALWHAAQDLEFDKRTAEEDFPAWSGATKDLLLVLGLEWDQEKDDYTFVGEPP